MKKDKIFDFLSFFKKIFPYRYCTINSELISNFFESIEGIEKYIGKIMNPRPSWNNYPIFSWALKALDADREFSWSIDDKEYAGKDYHDLWYTLDCDAKGILPDKLQVKK